MSQTVLEVKPIQKHKRRYHSDQCNCGAKMFFFKGEFFCIAEIKQIIKEIEG